MTRLILWLIKRYLPGHSLVLQKDVLPEGYHKCRTVRGYHWKKNLKALPLIKEE